MSELREKVIKGLSICGGDDPDCQNCPYYGEYGDGFGCETIMQRDALSLLIAQGLGWISVKDRKPETKGQYLVAAIEAGHYRRFGIVSFTDHFVMNGHRSYWKVTHWMPIPEMP